VDWHIVCEIDGKGVAGDGSQGLLLPGVASPACLSCGPGDLYPVLGDTTDSR